MCEISVGEANVGDVVAEPVANDQGLVLQPSGSKLSAAVLSGTPHHRGAGQTDLAGHGTLADHGRGDSSEYIAVDGRLAGADGVRWWVDE